MISAFLLTVMTSTIPMTVNAPAQGFEPSRSAALQQAASIRSNLRLSDIVLAQANIAGGAKAAEPTICRRIPVTGSLARKIKRCMSRADWAAEERAARDAANRATINGRCSEHGCN